MTSEDNVPFLFGDAGCGHVTPCPDHKDVVAFGWACSCGEESRRGHAGDDDLLVVDRPAPWAMKSTSGYTKGKTRRPEK